ncbi:MAG: RNA polymerase sigma factor [Chthoniobacterales bacterium]
MTPELPHQPVLGHNRFDTTRWSVVLSSAARDADSANGQEALSHLCRIYWRPIFAFIFRRGYSESDAQDLTQDFFANLLEGTLLQRADPKRGKFRSLLQKALQNFLIDARDKRMARKRGGDKIFISWDDWMAEAPSQLRVPAQVLETWTAERLFDIRWAATIVGRAVGRLREECENCGRRRVFDSLQESLSNHQSAEAYDGFSRELGVSTSVVRRLVYQLRKRYRELLREEVARTVESEADIDEEIRYLCAVLVAAAK